MKVYFISGLAADSRVFKRIQIPIRFETVYLDWIPAKGNETLEAYATRLAERIDQSEKFILVGLSMGGMVATEIAKKYKPEATIIISSAPTHNQFPYRFKLANSLKLYKLLPGKFFITASLIKRFFTTETASDKKLLEQVIKDSDPVFIKWALPAILQWKNEVIPQPFWHIHGSKDEIFPIKKIKPTHIITGGTHLMVLSKAAEVNRLLESLLDTVANRH